MKPALTLIAAVSADGFISRGKGVPWDLPRDRAHFRAQTAGKWLLLGRRTYEEMRGWFRDHTPLVLTRDLTLQAPEGHAVRNLAEALEKAAQAGVSEIFVCGGSAAYSAAMSHASRLLITHVETDLGGGVAFPVIDPRIWRVVSRERHAADGENVFAMEMVEYVVRASARL